MRNSEERKKQPRFKYPILNVHQILVYILVQIITVFQGLSPLLFNLPFNVIWFMLSYIIDNIAYALILALRGAYMPDKHKRETVFQVIGNFIQDVLEVLRKDVNDAKRIAALERLLVWTIRELNALYEKEFERFMSWITKKGYEGFKVSVSPVEATT